MREYTTKELFIGIVNDSVSDIFYYNRKNDDEIRVEDVNKLIEDGEVTLKEIVDTFVAAIKEAYPEIKES